MPLYEYQCGSCGERFERIQKFSDQPLEVCPNCGGPLRKLVSSPAFHLKGSGWYATDYGKKSGEPASSGTDKPEVSGKDEKKDDRKEDKKEDKRDDTAATSSTAETTKPASAAPSTDSSSKPSSTPASTKEN